MSDVMAGGQQEVCTTHQIRLKMNEESGRLDCPVCVQLDNQSRMSRRGRRR